MKYETFESLINVVVDMYKLNYERDRALSKALGGDTVVVTDDIGKFMDRITDIMSNELDDNENEKGKETWIDYLVYENMIQDNYDPTKLKIEINNKKYPVTPRVIWDILSNNI